MQEMMNDEKISLGDEHEGDENEEMDEDEEAQQEQIV